MAGTSIMARICTSPSPSPYPIEKIGDSPYPYPVNVGIPRQNGTDSGNTHGDGFICHLYCPNLKFAPINQSPVLSCSIGDHFHNIIILCIRKSCLFIPKPIMNPTLDYIKIHTFIIHSYSLEHVRTYISL